MVKDLKSITATIRKLLSANKSSGDSNIDFYLYSVNTYSTLHYSNLNLEQFGTFERRKFRIYSKRGEIKWQKIEVLPQSQVSPV